MLFVISPAKSLDYETPVPTGVTHTQPELLEHSAALIEVLREKSLADIARLMSISDALAALNVARYAEWSPSFTTQNARQALYAFNGDVYEGLDAYSLTHKQTSYLQDRLRILSGLYGVLRPLDLMQAYRLEMGTRLVTERAKDLYTFWGDQVTDVLKGVLEKQGNEPILVNLASEEYFKSVRAKRLAARVVTPVFEERKGNSYKIVSFYAKRARGLMCRFAAAGNIKDVEALKGFDLEGYAFASEASSADRWVFRRDPV